MSPMAMPFIQRIRSLELEEQILDIGAFVALIGVFLPWIGGQILGGENVTYAGFGFYTAFIGIAIALLHLFILLITIIPITGGPVLIRKRYRELVRFICSIQATILVLAALSVLTKVTLAFSRMEIRFGIYVVLIGSLVTVLYSFLRVQEQRRSQVQDIFYHPEQPSVSKTREENYPKPPAPPPPPAPEPEDHRIYTP